MSYNDSNEGKNDEKEVPMNKKLTMRDIAEYAGVTKSTVSRYKKKSPQQIGKGLLQS